MKNELKQTVYRATLQWPTKSDRQIAEDVGVSRALVWKSRIKMIKAIDYTLAREVAGKFLVEFQQAADYFKMQIEELEKRKYEIEQLKGKTKTIFRKGENGQSYADTVPLEPLDIAKLIDEQVTIEKHQTELWKNIIFLARQSEAVEVLKVIQNGGRVTATDKAVE